MTMTLVVPSPEYEQSYRDYIVELGDEERYPFQLDLEHHDFGALLDRLDQFFKGSNIPAGYVQTSTYWLVDGKELIGVSSLRHHLNDAIAECGGHIGLGIRPSRRGLGLGNTLMALTIREARTLGIGDIHVHCHEGNEASERMIVSNGGVLRSQLTLRDAAVTVQRYVVSALDNSFKPSPLHDSA